MGLNKNVGFPTSKLLKEKGFDIPTQKYYEYALKSKKDKQDGYSGSFGWKKGELNLQPGYFQNNNKSDFTSEMWYMCSAPTIAEVVCWLYDVHGIWIGVIQRDETSPTFFCKISINRTIQDEDINGSKWEYLTVDFLNVGTFNSPTEAYLEAINCTLKNLIK